MSTGALTAAGEAVDGTAPATSVAAPAARLTRTELAGYGALGLPLAFAALPLYVYAPKFYAELGLSLALSGAVLLAARIADALIDPWLGALSDRVRARKRFIAAFLLPLALGMFALFHPPVSGSGPLTLWLCACLAVVYLGFSGANIAYQAWGARVGPAQQRTAVTAWREGLGLAGVVIASLLPQWFAPTIEAGLPQSSIAFLGLLLVCAALTFRLAPPGEPARSGSRNHSPATSNIAVGSVLASRRFRVLLGVFALNGIASAIPATLFLFFVADVLQAPRAAGPFLAVYFLAAAVAMPLWVRMAARIGKEAAWLAAMALAIGAFVWAFFLGAGDTTAFAVICIASGVALGADLAVPPALLADVIEADGAQGGEGAYFGIWNLVTKLNLALAAGLTLPALAWAGYTSGSTAPAALGALAAAYCLAPCLLKLAAAALLARFRASP